MYQPQGWNYSDRVLKNVTGNGTIGSVGSDVYVGDKDSWITKSYVDSMLNARPDLFNGLSSNDLWTSGTVTGGNAENPTSRQGYLPTQQLLDILSPYGIQRRGAENLDGSPLGGGDYRSNVLVDSAGNVVYAGDPYKYNPSGDAWKSVGELAALSAAVFGGLGLAGAGPLGSALGGTAAGTTGAGIADASGLAAQNAALDAAMIDAGTSSAGGWGGLFGGAEAAGAAGGLGSLGGGSIDAAFADLAASSGSLAPEGIGAIIPTGAELGAIGGGGILAGGALGGGVGAEASWLDTLLGKAGGVLTGAAKDAVKKILPGGDSSGGLGDWAKYLLPALAGYASYKDAKQPTLQGYTGGIQPRTATQSVQQSKYGPVVKTKFAAGGGIPRYIDSHQDGMADGIGALIDGQQQAALSGGEFVVPADVVSHIGNGNSNAGAKQLYQMMDRIRAARTGTTQQGREINPTNFLPK